jgi:hypothetical protein
VRSYHAAIGGVRALGVRRYDLSRPQKLGLLACERHGRLAIERAMRRDCVNLPGENKRHCRLERLIGSAVSVPPLPCSTRNPGGIDGGQRGAAFEARNCLQEAHDLVGAQHTGSLLGSRA